MVPMHTGMAYRNGFRADIVLLLLLLLQDYAAILAAAESEADLVLWDGGNNDLPFYKPDLWLCIADPLRPGHEVMASYLELCSKPVNSYIGLITIPTKMWRLQDCRHWVMSCLMLWDHGNDMPFTSQSCGCALLTHCGQDMR
jgi:hypothetical protein